MKIYSYTIETNYLAVRMLSAYAKNDDPLMNYFKTKYIPIPTHNKWFLFPK